MSTTQAYSPVGLPGRDTPEALLHVGTALVIVALAVSSFAVWTPFGVAATFVLTLILANAMPSGVPVLIICAFLYQNLVVAWFTPYIPDNDTFDALRGTNFIILMTAFGIFLAASFQHRVRALTELRPWLLLSMVLCGTVCFYFALGVVHGGPKDAVVYFRNTITPLACFHIAVLAASLYPVDLRRSMLWLGAGAIIYGYAELIFTMDFLGLFHGDLYVERSISRQVETGVWEQALKETGFVYRGIEDVMTTTFFNTPLFNDILPSVFRIGGPNFHPISYAYALSTISAWLLFRGRWLLPVAALPLLLVIGSKGATFMLFVAIAARLIYKPSRAGLTLTAVIGLAVVWTTAAIGYGATHGDYHVLGLIAGMRDFLADPLGQGLGLGGNLSSTSINLNWQSAQAEGAASVPVESAVGVMLYQMGVGSLVFFGFLAALLVALRRQLIETGDPDFLFGFVGIATISANAVLQEEAFYSPLALAFCLLLVGISLGTRWRKAAAARVGLPD
ncbi:MAG: hypothetical protein E5X74_02120 [Mesorhizobium sp.]|uniref:hypothetical protein n=1 Tax=Mesorhizobium sp. TaxID=1871066 RepID=UPI0012051898|nr:hypothetical protein [Mesorhizobium sp.]TIO78524.1 MAG: hypothetical protein E5X75_05125 [Mesorhizobium sp.]TIO87827.1 MAG: hypothetical protein E5X74_02120 [Mesorhizobium sp.]